MEFLDKQHCDAFRFQDVIEQKYEAISSLVEGNIITSSDIGKPLLNHADGFKSVASKMFTSAKDTFFINNEVSCGVDTERGIAVDIPLCAAPVQWVFRVARLQCVTLVT